MAEYDGYLNSVSDLNIFNPNFGARLKFEDCAEGYVCIRTRWKEEQDITDHGNNPDSRYLQV